MNDQPQTIILRTIGSTTQKAPVGSAMTGRRLTLARLLWFAVLALALGLFLVTIPARQDQLAATASDNHAALGELGLTDGYMVVHIFVFDVLVIAAYSLIAAVIFWRRSEDWAAFFVSMTLLMVGAMITRPGDSVTRVDPLLHLPIMLVFTLASISIVLFLFIFPDGRFVPGWSRWLGLGWGALVVGWHFWPLLGLRSLPWPPHVVPYIFITFMLGAGLAAQVFRYRNVSNPAQRQQTKWVVFGLAGALQGLLWFLVLVPVLVPATVEQGLSRVIYILVGVPFFYLTTMLLPVSIGLSILRYRLWNIDTIINRTIVYGLLTGLLLALFVGGVVLLQSTFRAITGQKSDLAIAISTLASAALFQPLLQRIQDFIDRRFYRHKYDAEQALAAFNARVRNEVDLNAISGDLVSFVQETVQPSSAWLWLREVSPKREI